VTLPLSDFRPKFRLVRNLCYLAGCAVRKFDRFRNEDDREIMVLVIVAVKIQVTGVIVRKLRWLIAEAILIIEVAEYDNNSIFCKFKNRSKANKIVSKTFHPFVYTSSSVLVWNLH